MPTKTLGKGIGTTWVKIRDRIVELFHDDAGYINIGGKRFFALTGAITAGVTTIVNTSTPLAVAGSFGWTTNATGKTKWFVSDGTTWQALLVASSKLAGFAHLGAVAAATTTGKITQKDLNGVADGATCAGIVQPDVPRNVKLTITDGNASISAYSITVAGKAADGTTITENFTFADGLTPAGSKVFASITSVTIDSIVGDGAGDTLDMGFGSKLGVPVMYGATGLVVTNLQVDGTVEAASATDTTNNSFTPTTAPNGTKIFRVWFGYGFPA